MSMNIFFLSLHQTMAIILLVFKKFPKENFYNISKNIFGKYAYGIKKLRCLLNSYKLF